MLMLVPGVEGTASEIEDRVHRIGKPLITETEKEFRLSHAQTHATAGGGAACPGPLAVPDHR
uniref:Uncharacterized protein n=1 Tax=Anopheles albimanus TaxID=7167 RepID=A0A182FXT7_ANOAL